MKQAEIFRNHSTAAFRFKKKKRKKKKGLPRGHVKNHGLILAPFFYASILFLSPVSLRYTVDTCQLVPFGVHIATVSQ